MAIKIRCTECRKKVSIDEAFAGGMCRCPYCKALVYVPEAGSGAAPGRRPAAPGVRPEAPWQRPAAPGGATPPPPPGAPAPAQEHIPMARPVKIQGIITIVLLVLLLGMVGVGIYITLRYITPPARTDGPNVPDYEIRVDPMKVSKEGPAIAGVKLTASPVVYVIDAGSSMREAFDPARVMTETSVLSLGGKVRFNVLLCQEEEDRWMGEDFQEGGTVGRKAIAEFVKGLAPSGATDLPRALKAALEKKPKAIILLARKVVDDTDEVATEAKTAGVPIHTISIDSDPEVSASMKKLAEKTGGESEDYYSTEF